MKDLHQVIQSLTTHEKEKFNRYLSQNTKRADTKNDVLFKILAHNPQLPTGIDEQLYGKANKNALNVLSKRLFENLIQFLGVHSFAGAQAEEMQILKILVVARNLHERKLHKIANKLLVKAKKASAKIEQFNLINEILTTQIQYAQHTHLGEVTPLFHENKINLQKLTQEQQINQIYALAQQYIYNKNIQVNQELKNLLNQIEHLDYQNLSFKSIFRLLKILNQIGDFTKDFEVIFPFVNHIEGIYNANKNHQGRNTYFNIQILYYLANTYFRIEKFENCFDYLKQLDQELIHHKTTFEKQFRPQHSMLYALCLLYTNQQQLALEHLLSFNPKAYSKNNEYLYDIQLLKAVLAFQNQDLKSANSFLRALNKTDHWYLKSIGYSWTIKKNLFEIILKFELEETYLFESKIRSFKKQFSKYLITNNESSVLDFVNIIEYLFVHKNSIDEKKLQQKLKQLNSKNQMNTKDIFVQGFYKWLITRCNNLIK